MKSVNVTEPFLPPLEEYVKYLEGIWERNWLTNQGPLVQELERKLQSYHNLEVPVHCVANGALGLQIALKALGVGGEVITTPFSYVATTACPLWEGCSVKFADIEPDTLTIDPKAVEAAITPQTEAILATHVFGNPCDVEALDTIAAKHGLAMIYDAAHAFGVTYKGKSILEYGDASMVSLHATKLFHAVEGGFVVAKDSAVAEKMEWMRRFGHKGAEDFHGIGLNAKLSEFHAAMALCIFKYVSINHETRKALSESYDVMFSGLERSANSCEIRTMDYRDDSERNYAYYPVLFESESKLVDAMSRLNAQGIYPRRYFYPSLDSVEFKQSMQTCSVSREISARILCMPLAASYTDQVVDAVRSAIL